MARNTRASKPTKAVPPVGEGKKLLVDPDKREIAAMMEAANRLGDRRPAFKARVEKNANGSLASIGADHADRTGWYFRLLDAFGTSSHDFAYSVLNGLINGTGSQDGVDNVSLNAALAVVDGLRPRNEIEAMLAGQMAVTHSLAMELLRRAKRADHLPQFEAAGNMAVRLLRTYAAQVEALTKLRRGGEQTVRVEHVHVYPGGQAVVGNVNHREGGGALERNGQPHAPDAPRAVAFAPDTPMPSADPERKAVSIANSQGKEAMPDPRRKG